MILTWIARLLSLAITVLLFLFMFGGAEHTNFTPQEFLAVLFFPIGLVAGFGLSWWRPRLGAFVSLGSLAVFYLYMFFSSGTFPGGPYFVLFAIPAFLFLIANRATSTSTIAAR